MPIGVGLGIGFDALSGGSGGGGQVEESLFNRAVDTGGTGNNDLPVTVGMEIYPTVAGVVTKVYWWKPANDPATARTVGLFTHDVPVPLVTKTTSGESAGPGWKSVTLDTPYALNAMQPVIVSVHFPSSFYPATGGYFQGANKVNGHLVAPGADEATAGQGRFNYGASLALPENYSNFGNYWVDIGFVRT